MNAALFLLALAIQAAPAQSPEPTLNPLCEVAKRLDEGIKAFLSGKTMKESFKDWDSGKTTEAVETKLREDLAQNHVTTARFFAMELRLVFFAGEEVVHGVDALVLATPAETKILGMRSRANPSTVKMAVLPEKCAKDAKAFGDAGTALLKLVKANKPEALPYADPSKLEKLLPKMFQVEAAKIIEKAKEDAAETCKTIAELKYDAVKIQLDDCMFTVMGSDGLLKEGLIAADLKFTETGEVVFELKRYEAK